MNLLPKAIVTRRATPFFYLMLISIGFNYRTVEEGGNWGQALIMAMFFFFGICCVWILWRFSNLHSKIVERILSAMIAVSVLSYVINKPGDGPFLKTLLMFVEFAIVLVATTRLFYAKGVGSRDYSGILKVMLLGYIWCILYNVMVLGTELDYGKSTLLMGGYPVLAALAFTNLILGSGSTILTGLASVAILWTASIAMSRIALTSLSIPIVLAAFYLIKRLYSGLGIGNIRRLARVGAFLLVGVGGLLYHNPDLILDWSSRFSQKEVIGTSVDVTALTRESEFKWIFNNSVTSIGKFLVGASYGGIYYYDTEDAAQLAKVLDNEEILSGRWYAPHNMFVHVYFVNGIIGLLIFLLLVLIVVKKAIRIYFRPWLYQLEEEWHCVVPLSIVAIYLYQAMTVSPLGDRGNSAYLGLAFGIVMGTKERPVIGKR